MRIGTLFATALVFTPLLALCQKSDVASLEKEYSTLAKQFSEFNSKYWKGYSELKTQSEQSAYLSVEKNRPEAQFLPKFEALAKRAKGTVVAPEALSYIYNLAGSSGPKKRAAATEIIGAYPDSSQARDLAFMLGYENEEWVRPALIQLSKLAKSPETKATALCSSAAVVLNSQHATQAMESQARAALIEVMHKYSSTKAAERAGGMLFALDNIRIGKELPDFEATDQNGKRFRLSDFKGKVVVVLFWGFW